MWLLGHTSQKDAVGFVPLSHKLLSCPRLRLCLCSGDDTDDCICVGARSAEDDAFSITKDALARVMELQKDFQALPDAPYASVTLIPHLATVLINGEAGLDVGQLGQVGLPLIPAVAS